MRKKTGFSIFIVGLLFIFTGNSYAIDLNFLADQSSYKCRGGIVAVGDRDRTVRDKCGEPLEITRREVDSYDIWIYSFGSKFMHYFGFMHGKLQRIVSAPCSVNDPDCFDLR
jgi:hypothetical protein